MLRVLKLGYAAAALSALLVAGCGGGIGNSDAVCSDFRYQQDAQAAYADGATQLDRDGDGVACEDLASRPSGGGGGGVGGGTGGTEVPPAPEYNLMSALGEVTALVSASSGQYIMSVWGPFGSVSNMGPLGGGGSDGSTQVSNNFIGVRYGSRSYDLVPSWSNHGHSLQSSGIGGIGFVPDSRPLAAIAGIYRAIGQTCQQGRSPCVPVVGTLVVFDRGTMWICVNQDAEKGQCTAPLVFPVTRSGSDPQGMFTLDHYSARLLSSSSGSLAVSYQDTYESAENRNPTFQRTTWFGVLHESSDVVPLDASIFEGFTNTGTLARSPASSWTLQDDVPMQGFRRDASGRLALRGANGQLVTWTAEDGLQTFVRR
ncbi:excalibur calcium-binding domain-containing protein [Niveibacterium sp. SC-1]|uniref:excalibur calcium-binding domain-containing protein n=1 Tax=Niveibacterium sp. SC-1 TaxID=3135646 RepID=UPI00311D9422